MSKPVKKPAKKIRLDQLLVDRGLCDAIEQARTHILAGQVWSAQTRLEKSGDLVAVDISLEVRSLNLKFVSRAGFKLEHALDTLGVSVENKICLDVGASTGGFTDCLLQRGATHVFAVDVGTAQIHEKLKKDPRVTVMEQTNARTLTTDILKQGNPLAEKIEFVCGDVSFISLSKILPAVKQSVPGAEDWVLLFKPQFEVRREELGQGGIVKTPAATQTALKQFIEFATSLGLHLQDSPIESPLAGKKSGNVEILLHFKAETP